MWSFKILFTKFYNCILTFHHIVGFLSLFILVDTLGKDFAHTSHLHHQYESLFFCLIIFCTNFTL